MKKKTNGKKVAARAAPKKPTSKSRPEPDRLPVKVQGKKAARAKPAAALSSEQRAALKAGAHKPALDVTVKDGVTYTTSPGAVADLTEMVDRLQARESATAKRELMLNDEIARLKGENTSLSDQLASAINSLDGWQASTTGDLAAQIESLRAELTGARQREDELVNQLATAADELAQFRASGPPATLDKLTPLADLPAHRQLPYEDYPLVPEPVRSAPVPEPVRSAPVPPPPPAPPPKKVSKYKKQEPAAALGEIDADTLEALGLSPDNLK